MHIQIPPLSFLGPSLRSVEIALRVIKMKKFMDQITIISLAILVLPSLAAAQTELTYKADVPASITTPDSAISQYVGELTFVDGFPTDETIEKTYEFFDTSRAVELFLNATPVTSMYAMLNGHVEIGFTPNKTVGITETFMNARSLWLTAQTTTPYVHA